MIIDKKILKPLGLIWSIFYDLFHIQKTKKGRQRLEQRSIPVFSSEGDVSTCKDCDLCIVSCPTSAIFKASKGELMIDRSVCLLCSYCVDGCPSGLLQMSKDPQLLLFNRKDSVIALKR